MRHFWSPFVIVALTMPFYPALARADSDVPGTVMIAYEDTLGTGEPIPRAAAIDYEALQVDNHTFASRPLDPRLASGARRTISSTYPLAQDASSETRAPSSSRRGTKLLLTNGVTSIEGASGAGIASWATIAGLQTDRGIGASTHVTAIELPDFGWRSYGATIGIGDRLELSYARINFDTRQAGAALGLGEGYTFNQDVYGAKVRLAGNAVYGSRWLPQIALGAQYKRNLDGPILDALGADNDSGVDFTLSATKLLLEYSILVNATARYTKANQAGLLGFGSAAGKGYQLQVEGSLAYQFSRRFVMGAEYRSKPDNLGFGEDDWVDIFAAYAPTDNITVSAAYVDLGSIATFEDQRGGFLQAQISF